MPEPHLSTQTRHTLQEKHVRSEVSQTSTLTSEVRNPREYVIPLQTQGTKRPFFYLHGDWTGNAFFCFRLAHFVGVDQPFYLLTPYDFDNLDVPPTLEEVAAAHIASMRATQPEGPYQLGGFCNGGLTAYEMARQLHGIGERVDVLVLMDAIPPRTQAICATIRRSGALLRMSQARQLDWYLRMEHAYRYLLDKHADDFEHIKRSDARISAYFPPAETLRKEYPATFTWATSNYQPAFYPGKVVLFWDEAEPIRREWWNRWAKGQDRQVEEHIIPGTHFTCKTVHIEGMAERLRACLSQVSTAALF